ncbi:M24 family metallopeptidase [Leucobacter soli]|uniref:Ectoine hydrolase n=1 Tax=Leucobacter soli TaxID=2812850 RepID=A0A916JVX4_9MICO|nr:Xaa-Pro peptidase family protein [Leucobacter soli]CAG7608289.1 Ectoine hydrolase [Leucobacter soli]
MSPDPRYAAYIRAELDAMLARPKELHFTTEEYRERQNKARALMAEQQVDLLLISSPEAIAWLCGHALRWNKGQSPSDWPALQTLVLRHDSDRLVLFETNGHEEMIEMHSVVTDARIYPERDVEEALDFIVGELRSEGWLNGRVGVEQWSYIPNRYVGGRFEARLREAGCEIVDVSLPVRALRRVKSAQELQYIEKAAAICDAGLIAVRDVLQPGMTELEVWSEMLRGMVAAGGEPAALHESVVVGPIEQGHAFSTRREIKRGDYVWVDPCGVYNHYHANVAATFFVGEAPEEALEISAIQAGAYELLCQTARVGTPIRETNRVLKEYYEDAGTWGLHNWTGGYELGLSFPPDWVGEFQYTIGEEDVEGVFLADTVTNFESVVNFIMIDTVVYQESGTRTLSSLPHGVTVVPV